MCMKPLGTGKPNGRRIHDRHRGEKNAEKERRASVLPRSYGVLETRALVLTLVALWRMTA